MARHSLTEARRAVSDLRASVLEGHDLECALRLGAEIWTAGSGLEVKVEAIVDRAELPREYEQNLLRITQEAITNVLKHAKANTVHVHLNVKAKEAQVRIVDDGHGFNARDAIFSTLGGHFGLIGMRERAERLGGKLHLASHPGDGTEVEVTVPLP
jgi:signal transduction histidine kinase